MMQRIGGGAGRPAPPLGSGNRLFEDESGERPAGSTDARIGALLPLGTQDEDFRRGARRMSQRWQLVADIELLEPHSTSGTVLNASQGGMRVAVDGPVSVGELCMVRLRTEAYETTEACRVVWSRQLPDGCLLGLEFV